MNEELLTCELSTDDLALFMEKCKVEGKSVGEKLEELIKNFLTEGDNHLTGRKSA